MSLSTAGLSTSTNRTSMHSALVKELQAATSPWDRLPILVELTRGFDPGDPGFNRRPAEEALRLARELNDQFWIACSRQAMGDALRRTMCYAEALTHLREASGIFERINEPRMKARADLSIADIHIVMGEYEEGLQLILRCRRVFKDLDDLEWTALALRSLGNFYKAISDHVRTIKCFRRAIAIALRIDLASELGELYQHLSEGYRRVGHVGPAWKYLAKSLDMARRQNDRRRIAASVGSAAALLMSLDKPERAEKYIRWSIGLNHALGHTTHSGMSWAMLGDVYKERKDFAKALRCFRRAVRLAGKSESILHRGILFEQMGLLHMEMKDYSRGLFFLRKGLALLEQTGQPFVLFKSHEKNAKACEAAGDTVGALYHFKEYTRLHNDHLDAQKFLEVSRAEIRRKVRKLSQRLRKEQSRNNTLKQEVEEKEAELLSMTRQLIREPEDRDTQTTAILNGSARSSNGYVPENWNLFARQFHKVHHGFYPDLIRRYPNLTPTEVKVCSLIRIGLSSKEIAGILCVSKRTVDNHRMRVHKKIDLPAGTSLATFIVQM